MIGRRTLLAAASASALVGRAHASEIGSEPALLPELEIVDPHHHMQYAPPRDGQPAKQYLLPELAKDIAESGHRVVETVAVESFGMYRQDGPPEMKPVGETEFLNGIAAMSASGLFGPCRVGAGIVAYSSLRLGDRIEAVMEAHHRAAGDRLKGIRDSCAWDAYPVMGRPLDPARKTLLEDPASAPAMRVLARMGLSFDTWCFHHQIGDVAKAARQVPGLTVVLNHIGSPLAVGPYAGKEKDVFRIWSAAIKDAAKVPNIVVKMGGLGMQFSSPTVFGRKPPPTSTELAALWKPYFETCIEAFGASRCMFESNFPPDGGTASYGVFWNAFKRIAEKASAAERAALFSGTAKRVYKLA